jgi:hypothetical protein
LINAVKGIFSKKACPHLGILVILLSIPCPLFWENFAASAGKHGTRVVVFEPPIPTGCCTKRTDLHSDALVILVADLYCIPGKVLGDQKQCCNKVWWSGQAVQVVAVNSLLASGWRTY